MRIAEKCATVSFFVLIVSALLVIAAFAHVTQSCGEEIASYDVSVNGDGSVTVKLYCQNGEYRLVISGDGEMREYSSSDEIPWLEYSDRIVGVTVEMGVMGLSKFFFQACSALKELWVYETHLTFVADKQYIPYTVKIYGHFNSTAHFYVFENHPSRFFSICDFSDSVCSTCGFTCENHSGGKPSCTERGKCEICGAEYLDFSGHKLSALVPKKTATCYSPGMSAHYLCLFCDAIFDENGEPTEKADLEITAGHDFGELRKYVAPTCTEPGSIAHYECSFCHEFFGEDMERAGDILISALGHVGGKPTCISGAVCERCDTVYTEPDLINHSYSEEVKYSQTLHWRECACGDKTDESEHTLTNKIVKAPTESEMGILESSCICGYKDNKYIPKLAPTVNDNISDGSAFPIYKLIIIIVFSVLLCASLTAIVIIIIKYKKA